MKVIDTLIPGEIIQYRSGEYAIFVSEYYNIKGCFLGEEVYMPQSEYKDDLTHIISSEWDIIAIYQTPLGCGLKELLRLNNKDRKLVWKRTECLELTLKDIADKFNVKSIKIIDNHE